MLWLQSDFEAENQGVYRFTIRAKASTQTPIRLWLARAATPDFAGAQWQEVALKNVDASAKRFGDYNLTREAKIAIGSGSQKYLAVRAEAELPGEGGTRRFFSKTTVLPRIAVYGGIRDDATRIFYVSSSEPLSALHLKFATSVARDFAATSWQNIPMTPGPNFVSDGWYEAVAPATTAAKPWIAAYAEGELPNATVRLTSPILFWNGLPFPKPANELRGDICPLHGNSEDVVPIIYGYATSDSTPGAIHAGCMVGPGSPTWHCKRCDRDWGDVMAENEASQKDNS